jgi:hypothetical protein
MHDDHVRLTKLQYDQVRQDMTIQTGAPSHVHCYRPTATNLECGADQYAAGVKSLKPNLQEKRQIRPFTFFTIQSGRKMTNVYSSL